MEGPGYRLNLTLGPEHAARLAERALAIEEADPEARHIVAVLDGIPGAYEHAMQSLERAHAGETIALDEL
jgi:hypothetical protein